MMPGAIYAALGAALLSGAWLHHGWIGRLLCLYAAVPCVALGGAYFLRKPGLFLKRPDGRLAPVSWIVFGAYHVTCLLFLACYRPLARKEPWHEVIPGLYVGCRPGRRDEGFWKSRRGDGGFHVLDLTAELPAAPWVRNRARYLCLRLLDRTAPDLGDLEKGVAFIGEGLVEGIVLVHCAFGHSRSALYVAAYLMASGRCRTAEEAWLAVQEKRPGAYLNAAQRLCLERAAASGRILTWLPHPVRAGH
jgi:hypothetical protein